MRLQRVGHELVTEHQQQISTSPTALKILSPQVLLACLWSHSFPNLLSLPHPTSIEATDIKNVEFLNPEWKRSALVLSFAHCLAQSLKLAKVKNETISHSVMSNSLWPYGLRPARLLCPWDSPGKNTAVGKVIPFSRGPSWPRDQIQDTYISGRVFTIWATREALTHTKCSIKACWLNGLKGKWIALRMPWKGMLVYKYWL